MKKRHKITLIIIITIIILIFLSIFIFNIIKSPRCSLNGGVWRMFSNGCGDSCVYERQTPDNPVACTMAFAPNCDCGPFRCWNSETKRCELN